MRNNKTGENNKGEVQMSNIKCQLKSQYIMSNFEFYYLDFNNDPRSSQMSGIDLAVIQQFFPFSSSLLGYGV